VHPVVGMPYLWAAPSEVQIILVGYTKQVRLHNSCQLHWLIPRADNTLLRTNPSGSLCCSSCFHHLLLLSSR